MGPVFRTQVHDRKKAHTFSKGGFAPPPPLTLLVALVWQCRGWLLAAVGRAVSPCHF